MGGNKYDFYKENYYLAFSIPATMVINDYSKINSYPSPYTLNLLYYRLHNNFSSNSIVTFLLNK